MSRPGFFLKKTCLYKQLKSNSAIFELYSACLSEDKTGLKLPDAA